MNIRFILSLRKIKQNEIPNIVLSSATLPTSEEIFPMIASFKNRFNGEQFNIVSYDCNKTIQLLNTQNYCSST